MSAADIFPRNYIFPRIIFLAEKWSFEGKFEILGQSHSQEHYQPTYQKARGRFVYLITLPLIFVSRFDSKFVNFFCTFRSNIWDQLLNASISGPYKTNSFSFKKMKTRNSWSGFFPAGFVSFRRQYLKDNCSAIMHQVTYSSKKNREKINGWLIIDDYSTGLRWIWDDR